MRRKFIVLVALVVLLAGLPGIAAAEQRAGGTVVVGPDETVADDLDAVGGSVVVEGTVTGDLNAFGGDVRVAEGGTVDGDVEAAGGSVDIAGTVGGDVQASGGSVRIADTGEIGGSFQAAAGSIEVNGTIAGDAELAGETIRLGPNALIQGNLDYSGELIMEEGATVDGEITESEDVTVGLERPELTVPFLGPLFGIYEFFVTLLVGGVLLFAFPRFSTELADRIEDDPVRTGGIGLLAALAIPILLVIIFVTIIGIPLSLAGFFLYGLLVWVASVYGRYAVGEWILSYTETDNRWLALVVGILAVALVSLVPLLGSLVETVVLLLGFGALVLGFRKRYRTRNDIETRTATDGEPV